MEVSEVKKKTKTHLFTIFGIEVNLSSVLTTIVGSLSWLLISTGLTWIHDVKTTLNEVKAEQQRIKKDYAPPISAKK